MKEMFGKLFLLFTVVPLVELYLLIQIGTRIGALPTVAIVIGTGLAGAYLARQQGFAVWMRIQREMAGGRFPAQNLLDGLLLLVAGVVLITPGILTDILGFLLIFPVTRAPIRDRLAARFRRMMDDGTVIVHDYREM
jgi:UPF0716 protein FxsA